MTGLPSSSSILVTVHCQAVGAVLPRLALWVTLKFLLSILMIAERDDRPSLAATV